MADKLIGDAILTKTHVADSALGANLFVVNVTGTGYPSHVALPSDGDPACGVTRDSYRSGDPADIVHIGTAWVITSQNVNAGQKVATDAAGKAYPSTTAKNDCGLALSDANSGEAVLVLLSVGGIF